MYTDLSLYPSSLLLGFPGGTHGEESSCQYRRGKKLVQFLGREDSLENKKAPYSSILAWRIPWTQEPSRLQHN